MLIIYRLPMKYILATAVTLVAVGLLLESIENSREII